MTLTIDRKVYTDQCISSAIYWLSNKYVISRTINGDIETISTDTSQGDKFRTELFKLLNDYKLRGIIEAETKDIRTILYAKAFGDFDGFTEDDLAK